MHRNASQGYARSADLYTRGRPSYPESAVSLILDGLNLESAVVVDVGSGPGTLAIRLAEQGATVIAVEPVHAMAAKVPAPVQAVRGAALRLPFRTATVDTIVVGTAFHWFAGTEMLTEAHRVLKPGSRLQLLWNTPDRTSAFVQSHDELVSPYIGDTPRYVDMKWRRELERAEHLFQLVNEQHIANPTTMTHEHFVERVMSTSFIAALDSQERDSVRHRAAELARSAPETFDYPYSCHVVQLNSACQS